MQKICFHFQVNQPYLLRTYRFFDINHRNDYFDDYQNNYLINRIAERCYIPANAMFLNLIHELGKDISLSFSISGSSISLFKSFCPEVLDGFKKLVATGQVEITGSTYSHSLASLNNKSTFFEQIHLQEQLLMDTFDILPLSFCNTEAIYSDEIGEWLHEAGYKLILTEGARHILGWKSPAYLYCNPYQTEEKLLLRNSQLSDDITFRFEDKSWNQYPLTAEKYISFLKSIPDDAHYINIYLDYEVIGDYHTKESGIFEFFKDLFNKLAQDDDYQFINPKNVIAENAHVSTMHAPWPISGSGDEKDTGEWLGNELQQEAFEQLFKLEPLYLESENEKAKLAWLRMQNALHFNFMGTKWFPQNAVKNRFDVYPSPYQAFINYMNVLNDIKIQLTKHNK